MQTSYKMFYKKINSFVLQREYLYKGLCSAVCVNVNLSNSIVIIKNSCIYPSSRNYSVVL